MCALLVLCPLGGCTTLDYYAQAALGQLEIWCKQEDIDTLLESRDLPKLLRRKLTLVNRARDFAVATLALPAGGSYRRYADLERPFVVWNVFATLEFSLQPLQTCFLIVGCLDYRGHFSQARAERHASALRARGFDVYIGGVAAYSTLGWFDDPALNTIVAWKNERIVEIIFHELAHRRVYISDDTVFNESFAMAVAKQGLVHWSQATGTTRPERQLERRRDREFVDFVLEYREQLQAAFERGGDKAAKREAKRSIYANLRRNYAALRAAWNGYNGYDDWIANDLNNAKIASIAIYHDYVPAFETILSHYGSDFETFYGAIERLGKLEREKREACLTAILGRTPLATACAVALALPRLAH